MLNMHLILLLNSILFSILPFNLALAETCSVDCTLDASVYYFNPLDYHRASYLETKDFEAQCMTISGATVRARECPGMSHDHVGWVCGRREKFTATGMGFGSISEARNAARINCRAMFTTNDYPEVTCAAGTIHSIGVAFGTYTCY